MNTTTDLPPDARAAFASMVDERNHVIESSPMWHRRAGKAGAILMGAVFGGPLLLLFDSTGGSATTILVLGMFLLVVIFGAIHLTRRERLLVTAKRISLEEHTLYYHKLLICPRQAFRIVHMARAPDDDLLSTWANFGGKAAALFKGREYATHVLGTITVQRWVDSPVELFGSLYDRQDVDRLPMPEAGYLQLTQWYWKPLAITGVFVGLFALAALRLFV